MYSFVAITPEGKYLQKRRGKGLIYKKDTIHTVSNLNDATIFTVKDLRPIGNSLDAASLKVLSECEYLMATAIRIVNLI